MDIVVKEGSLKNRRKMTRNIENFLEEMDRFSEFWIKELKISKRGRDYADKYILKQINELPEEKREQYRIIWEAKKVNALDKYKK